MRGEDPEIGKALDSIASALVDMRDAGNGWPSDDAIEYARSAVAKLSGDGERRMRLYEDVVQRARILGYERQDARAQARLEVQEVLREKLVEKFEAIANHRAEVQAARERAREEAEVARERQRARVKREAAERSIEIEARVAQQARENAAAYERERAELARVDAERRARWLSRPAPAPAPQPFGVSHEGAEHLVAAWMRHLGVLDAEVTQYSGDGGIDVSSATHLVQVKNFVGTVPIVEVRALYGVAAAESKRPVFFTSGTFSTDGLAFANSVGMVLVRYSAERGTLSGLNTLGRRVVDEGFDVAHGVG